MNKNHVIPGEELGSVHDDAEGGRGTYTEEDGLIRSSLIGSVVWDGRTVHVISSLNSVKDPAIQIGDVVLCRVIKVTVNYVATEILSVKDIALRGSLYMGSIRRGDVRLHEEDSFVMLDFFRLGDIVRAVVLSLGDTRQYFLSTSEAEYGVRFAKSKAGNMMIPQSWKEMEDPVTKMKEKRKVAKP